MLVLLLAAVPIIGCQQKSVTSPTTSAFQSGKSDFKITSLDVVPVEVTMGQESTVTLVVTNVGTIEGSHAVVLRINGALYETKEVTITPGSSKPVTFIVKRDTPGNYEIKVEDMVASLVVKGGTPVTQTPTVTKAVVAVSFDPNPVPYVSGRVSYKVILRETNGVGITLKRVVDQGYSSQGPGQPHVYETLDWFQQWLPNAYLSPNGEASMNAGTGSGWTYYTYEFTGIDDNGHQIVATARVDFIQ